MSDDNERIGLSSSIPAGQEVRFIARLSGQTGWRRTVARVFAVALLAAIVAVIVVAAASLLT